MTTTFIVYYADDTMLLTSTLPELQSFVDLIVENSKRFWLSINTPKIKLLIFSKIQTDAALRLLDDII